MNLAVKKLSIYSAMKLFKDFRGEDPKYIDELEIPLNSVFMLVGECDGILYTTTRDGKKERYIHEFRSNSKPLLAASSDGKQIILLEGKYKFTERGIVDKG